MKLLHQFNKLNNPYRSDIGNKQPSLYEEPEITGSVKPVDDDIANIEAEKNEIILKPDLSGLYLVNGKKHSQGGTKLKVDPGSFIFSDFKDLSISKEEQELLKFQKGGSTKKALNTPAEILKRNVDIKHYNKMINTINDNSKDSISKKTAELMLGKYQKTLGKIAYAQEEKKNFEEEPPEFAKNSAPVMDEELQNNIDKQEQFQKGGMTNPYLPKAQSGGNFWDIPGITKKKDTLTENGTILVNGKKYININGQLVPEESIKNTYPNLVIGTPGSNPVANQNTTGVIPTANRNNTIPTQTEVKTNSERPSWLKMWTKANQNPGGYTTPTGQDSRYKAEVGNEIYDNYDRWKGLNGGKEFKDAKDYQNFVYNYIIKKDPSAITNMWTTMGLTNASKTDVGVLSGDKFGTFNDGLFGARTAALTNWKEPIITPASPITPVEAAKIITPTPEPKLPIPDNKTILPYNPNVKKTLPMLEDELLAGYQAVGVKKYNPYRSQIKTPGVELERLNAQGALNVIDQTINQGYNATRGLNPYQAQSTINELFGKALESKQNTQFKYDSENIGIGNEQNKISQGIQARDLQQNIKFDSDYYDKSVLANSHYDNAKGVAWNAFQGVRNQNQETLDSLYNVLAQQPIAGSKQLYNRDGTPKLDDKGNKVFQGMPLFDVAPGTIRTYNTGVGNIMNVAGSDRAKYDYAAQYQDLYQQLLKDPTNKALAAAFSSLGTMVRFQSQPQKKMGGSFNPYLNM